MHTYKLWCHLMVPHLFTQRPISSSSPVTMDYENIYMKLNLYEEHYDACEDMTFLMEFQWQ